MTAIFLLDENTIFGYNAGVFVNTNHLISFNHSLTTVDLNDILLSSYFKNHFNSKIYIIKFKSNLCKFINPLLPVLDSLHNSLCSFYNINPSTSDLDLLYYFYIISYYDSAQKYYFSVLLIIDKKNSNYFCGPALYVKFSDFRKFKKNIIFFNDYLKIASSPVHSQNNLQQYLFSQPKKLFSG